ncbi:MAG: hypothetical protein HKN75_03510 [Bacteroidia bacterium]|nr:hypothetical protein [Bacteroidia bacterium]
MCTRKTINLKRTELQFLRKRISEKYATDENLELTLNSNRNSYAALKRNIKSKLKGKVEIYISEYLLFKLFYETKHSSEANFNLAFINTLYFYLTEGRKNRHHYFNFSTPLTINESNQDELMLMQQAHLNPIEETPVSKEDILGSIKYWMAHTKSTIKPVAIFLLLFISFSVVFAFSYRAQKLGNNANCSYWVCKYEDGTKVWSRFEGDINYNDVLNYFEGNAKRNRMNCEAFRMENNTRISICYDNILAKQYMLEHGNVKCIYRE